MNKKSKKKKIDIIVKYFYPVVAGIETNIIETYSVLALSGWEVRIHTSKDILTKKNILKDFEDIRGIKVLRYPFKWWGFFPKIDWFNSDLICLHNFDIFPHINIMLYCFFLKIIGRKRFKLTVTPHGGFNPEWSIFSKSQQIIKKTYHFTLGVLLINSVVDAVRAVSDWEKKQILSKGVRESLVITISNGIEDAAFGNVGNKASKSIRQKVMRYGKYIIQIGRIYPIKNYETTIKALNLLPKDINFVIVGPEDHVLGKEDYRMKLNNLIRELNLEKRVFFAGVVRGTDKFYLIKNAQMMVHMAIWESFCNVVHEGMSQGLVCLVADNTALRLLVKEGVNGFRISTKDYKTLANKILYTLKNKNRNKIISIRRNNMQESISHSWRNVARSVNRLYGSLLIK